MKPKNILVLGASGQLGRNLLRKLTRNNFKVTAITRNIHKKGLVFKSQANAGWLDIVELETFDNSKLKQIFNNKDICINLIGILNEKNKTSFNNIHCLLPKKLAELSKENNLKQFIHLSALGIENAKDSKYASSKLDGEIEIKNDIETFSLNKVLLFILLYLDVSEVISIFSPLSFIGMIVFKPSLAPCNSISKNREDSRGRRRCWWRGRKRR